MRSVFMVRPRLGRGFLKLNSKITYMSLPNKYRPKTLEDVQGNQETVESLQSYFESERDVPHAFLFIGESGCGKTTLARILANKLGAVGSDFQELDSAQMRGIDTAREIRKNANFKPVEGNVRVWLIDEVHQMTKDAQEALLKVLEDAPEHVYFMLSTTEPEKLKKTLRGRCAEYQVNPLSERSMLKFLKRVSKKEGEAANMSREVYLRIAEDSQGRPRDALNILDKVLRIDPENRLEAAKKHGVAQAQGIELARELLNGGSWKKIAGILSGLKTQEPESVRRQVIGYMSAVLLKKDNERAGLVMEEFMEPFYNSGFPGLVFACYSVVKS
jgi:DNA polymerase-3 subunit gamma/tau